MNHVFSGAKLLALLLLVAFVAGCSKMTRFEAPEPDSRLELLGREGDALPRSVKLPFPSRPGSTNSAPSPPAAKSCSASCRCG